MNKKILFVPIVIVVGLIVLNFLGDSEDTKNNVIFHETLAEPEIYVDGIYLKKFHIDSGEYYFRFVPNGSSPEVLSILVTGENVDFSKDYILEGTLQDTGISEYYTWEYIGDKSLTILEDEEITITIDPNGSKMGSVSVDILQKKSFSLISSHS